MPILISTGDLVSRTSVYKYRVTSVKKLSHFQIARTTNQFYVWRYSKKYFLWRNNQISIQNNKCFYCATSLSKSKIDTEHVVPRSKGGTNHKYNLVLSCTDCNKEKGSKMPAAIWIERARLLHKK